MRRSIRRETHRVCRQTRFAEAQSSGPSLQSVVSKASPSSDLKAHLCSLSNELRLANDTSHKRNGGLRGAEDASAVPKLRVDRRDSQRPTSLSTHSLPAVRIQSSHSCAAAPLGCNERRRTWSRSAARRMNSPRAQRRKRSGRCDRRLCGKPRFRAWREIAFGAARWSVERPRAGAAVPLAERCRRPRARRRGLEATEAVVSTQRVWPDS